MFHSCLPSQSPSVLALSYFTCIILHSLRVCDCMHLHVLKVCMYMHVLKACTCMHGSQACHISACVCLYQELSRYLHVCCWFISRDECVSPFISLYRELSVCLHVARELSICWHVSRAEHVSSFSFLCGELCVCLQVLSVSRVERVCAPACTYRVSACICAF